MKNEVMFIQKEQTELIIKKYQSTNDYIAKLDGNKINTLVDYMNAIIIAFQFPKGMFQNTSSIDSYNDWMRDLNWIGQYDGYILIIEHYDQMMKNDLKYKKIILDEFNEVILPFWGGEVLSTVVGGKIKKFKVYLVE